MYNLLQTHPYVPHSPSPGNHLSTLFLNSTFFFFFFFDSLQLRSHSNLFHLALGPPISSMLPQMEDFFLMGKYNTHTHTHTYTHIYISHCIVVITSPADRYLDCSHNKLFLGYCEYWCNEHGSADFSLR